MSDAEEVGPIRTCVGGGGRHHQDLLERFVWDERMGLLFDVRKKAPGRGAWVTPERTALAKALKCGFSRAFKTRIEVPELETLVDEMAQAIKRRLHENVNVAIRSRKAWVGATLLDEGMRSAAIASVLMARDAGDSTRKKYVSNADRKGIQVFEVLSGDELGSFVGKDFVAVLGLAEPAAAKVAADIHSLRLLGAIEG